MTACCFTARKDGHRINTTTRQIYGNSDKMGLAIWHETGMLTLNQINEMFGVSLTLVGMLD